MRNTDRIDPATKLGRSKGYGFIEFTRHSDALSCLRWLNNNPTAFKALPEEDQKETESSASANRQRPIVEFAIENKMVVKRRADRQKDSKFAKNKDEKDSGKRNKMVVDQRADRQKDPKFAKGIEKRDDKKRKAEGDNNDQRNSKAFKKGADTMKTHANHKQGTQTQNEEAANSKKLKNVNKSTKSTKSVVKPKTPTKIDLQLPAADVKKWMT